MEGRHDAQRVPNHRPHRRRARPLREGRGRLGQDDILPQPGRVPRRGGSAKLITVCERLESSVEAMYTRFDCGFSADCVTLSSVRCLPRTRRSCCADTYESMSITDSGNSPLIVRAQMGVGNGPPARMCVDRFDDLHGRVMIVLRIWVAPCSS